jgi:hypothetical protein
MARISATTPLRVCRTITIAVCITAASGCMLSPRHGAPLPRMGAPMGLVAYGPPGAVFTFEYALHRFDGTGYVIDEWRPLGTCVATGPVFTDVDDVDWQGCAISTTLPVSDCAKGGRGAWRGNPADPASAQRFARVRTMVNGGALFVFPSTVTDAQLEASYNSVGGLDTIAAYQAGTQAEVHVDLPAVGAGAFADSAAATDVVVVGDRAYVGRGAGSGPEFGIFEVADAGTPQLRKTVEIGASVAKVAVEGDYAYLATNDPLGQLVIVSVVDPDAAAVVRRIALPGPEAASAVAAIGGTVLVGRKNRAGTGNRELEVWSPADSAHLIDLSQTDTFEIGADVNAIDVTAGLFVPPATQVERTVAFLATSHPTDKIRAVDVSDPADITGHDTYALSGAFGLRDVAYHHGNVYAVADNNAGADVFVFQLSGTTGRNHTLTGSRALDTNNTGVVFYADKLLVSTQTAAKAVTTLDPTVSPPAVVSVSQSTAGGAALAVRQGVAHLATGAATQLQLVSAGLQLEPTLPSTTVLGCLGDSNTAQGIPACSLGNPYFPTFPTCPGMEPPECALESATSPETTVVCPNGGIPTCPPNKGVPACALSWCTRAALCFAADPLAAPTYCSVEGRHWVPRPAWSRVNPGAGLAPIVSNPDHPADGPEQMSQAAAAGATAFVLALGSVDMLGNFCGGIPTLPAILDGLEVLRLQAAGAPVFYTVPPPFNEAAFVLDTSCCEVPNGFECFNRAMLRYKNRLLHELPPERVIDLHSGVVRNADFGPDGVHFNAAGQSRRARVAVSKLAD